jgi:lipopolysaccharide transport system ATP-binding protein
MNQAGVILFGTIDIDPTWRGRTRPAGSYISSVHIPGNFLADGMTFVSTGLLIQGVSKPQFWERSVVAFQVVENFGSDSARGDYTGHIEGAVRPLLQWGTEFHATAP